MKKKLKSIITILLIIIGLTTTSYAENEVNKTKSNTNLSNTTQEQTTQTGKSNVATLSNLGIKPNDFKGFKSDTYSYTTEVPNEIDKVEIYAYLGHKGQTISGTGDNKKLDIGENIFEIIVTAEDKITTQTYKINIIRKGTEEEPAPETNIDENIEEPIQTFGLSELKIEESRLEPEFQTDIYEYKIDLKEDLEKLNISTMPTHANTTIDISGNENLIEGENVITIIVKTKSEEDNTLENNIATYQIVVNKTLEKEEIINTSNEELSKKDMLISIGLIFAIIIEIVIIIRLSKNKDEGEYVKYTDFYSEDLKEYDEKFEEDNFDNNSGDTEVQIEVKKKRNTKGKRFK